MRALALGLFSLTLVGLGPLACTAEGKDVATTFFDPTSNPNTNPPGTGDSGDSDSPATEDSGPPPQTDGDPTSPPGDSGEADTGSTTGVPPVDEQPASGQYSPCTSVANCIGQTTCVIVPGAAEGFCSSSGCAVPGTDCDPNPGASSNAAPACVDDGTGALVCALGCAGGLTCPGGMQCLPLGSSQVCV